MDPVVGFPAKRDGDEAVIYLAASDDDGDVPHRSIYWFLTAPPDDGWRIRLPSSTLDRWLADAVPADLPPGADKRSWRLATRWAMFRLRAEPPALGVSSPVLGDLVFERLPPRSQDR